MTPQDSQKKRVGEAVARMVEPGMRLGVGTGSTAAWAVRALGARVQGEGLEVVGVPTSFASERLMRACGLAVSSLDVTPDLDLAFDGADEFDPHLNLIKGRGAAQTREKIVAAQARRFVVLVDGSKRVARLGEKAAVPIEIVPMALVPITRALEGEGLHAELRLGRCKDGPVVTDQGLWIVDASAPAGGLPDAPALARMLDAMPGVLEHGLFLGMATDVLVGEADGAITHLTAGG